MDLLADDTACLEDGAVLELIDAEWRSSLCISGLLSAKAARLAKQQKKGESQQSLHPFSELSDMLLTFKQKAYACLRGPPVPRRSTDMEVPIRARVFALGLRLCSGDAGSYCLLHDYIPPGDTTEILLIQRGGFCLVLLRGCEHCGIHR
eukprot:scaffold94_cov340-Prasinococcus_capsulatus_cf.AAC.8